MAQGAPCRRPQSEKRVTILRDLPRPSLEFGSWPCSLSECASDSRISLRSFCRTGWGSMCRRQASSRAKRTTDLEAAVAAVASRWLPRSELKKFQHRTLVRWRTPRRPWQDMRTAWNAWRRCAGPAPAAPKRQGSPACVTALDGSPSRWCSKRSARFRRRTADSRRRKPSCPMISCNCSLRSAAGGSSRRSSPARIDQPAARRARPSCPDMPPAAEPCP